MIEGGDLRYVSLFANLPSHWNLLIFTLEKHSESLKSPANPRYQDHSEHLTFPSLADVDPAHLGLPPRVSLLAQTSPGWD